MRIWVDEGSKIGIWFWKKWDFYQNYASSWNKFKT